MISSELGMRRNDPPVITYYDRRFTSERIHFLLSKYNVGIRDLVEIVLHYFWWPILFDPSWTSGTWFITADEKMRWSGDCNLNSLKLSKLEHECPQSRSPSPHNFSCTNFMPIDWQAFTFAREPIGESFQQWQVNVCS